jgi:hypothetical protein
LQLQSQILLQIIFSREVKLIQGNVDDLVPGDHILSAKLKNRAYVERIKAICRALFTNASNVLEAKTVSN